MNADKGTFQLVFPVSRRVRIGRLDVDPKKHFRLCAAPHHLQKLFERRDIVMLKQYFAQMQHGSAVYLVKLRAADAVMITRPVYQSSHSPLRIICKGRAVMQYIVAE